MSFNYTTGNPDNLVGGNSASMGDIQGSFYDLRAYLNSGALDTIARTLLIVGEVRFIAVPAAPALWLPCNGAAYSRSTYSTLFAAIGTTWGAGDGTTTFNVPDVQGRTLVGAGAGAGLTNRVIATKWGVEALVLAANQLPAHSHPDNIAVSAGGDHNHTITVDGASIVNPGLYRIPFNGGVADATPVLSGSGGFHIPIYGIAAWQGTDGAHGHTASSGPSGTHAHGRTGGVQNSTAPSGAAPDNSQPSLAVPAYIYAAA